MMPARWPTFRPTFPLLWSTSIPDVTTVDHVDGNYIKLTRNGSPDGQHHWIPMDWVTRVDAQVHVDRPGDQAMREWSTTPTANA